MPPKKRLRGPRLASVQEEAATPRRSRTAEENEQLETEEFENDRDDTETMVDELESLKVDEDKTEKMLRKCIIDAFRQTFQARSDINQDISVSTQKMCIAYKNFRNKKKQQFMMKFFQEVDARLVMFIDEVTVKEHRSRVFKMISLAALEIFKEPPVEETCHLRDDHFLKFIVGFIEQWGMSSNVAARMNSSSMITYLIESGIKGVPDPENTCYGMPLKMAEQLFLQVKRSLCDREAMARVQAIRSLGVIAKQPVPSMWSDEAKESSPRELLMRSFRDISYECRLVALQVFTPKEHDVPVLADLVMYDKSLKVRIAALEKIGECLPAKHIREKIACLELSLKDHEKSMRSAAKKLLTTWITKLSDHYSKSQKAKLDPDIIVTDLDDRPLEETEHKNKGFFLAAALLVMLWLEGSPETVEAHSVVKRLTTYLLDVVRHMYHCQDDPINTLAEVLTNDLKNQDSTDITVAMITKSGIAHILEDSEFNEIHDVRTVRSMVFFWRCTIDYIVDRKLNEGDKMSALARFITPLKTLVESFETILERIHRSEFKPHTLDARDKTTEGIYILEMSLIENFLSVMKHAPSDQSGKDAYRTLLVRMLTNPCYQKKIIDLIIIDLGTFYTDCPEDMLSLVYAKVNEVRQKCKSSGLLPKIEGTVLVGEAHTRTKYSAEGNRRKSASEKTGAHLMELYDLMVINSVLKTGILKDWAEEYDDRYSRLIQRNISSKDVDMKVLAMECVGIIAYYDLSKAERMLGDMISKAQSYDEHVRGTLFTVVTDVAIVHGLEVVDQMMKENSKEEHFLKLLGDIIVSTPPDSQSELLLKAVEGMAKIMLHASVDPNSEMWQRAMVAMMFRASYAITDRFAAKVRSTIVVMLNFFCTLNRNNQMLLVKSFKLFYEMWQYSTSIDYLAPSEDDAIKKLKRCALAFVTLTRHSNLRKEAQKCQPVHVTFVDAIFNELLGNATSNSIDYFLVALLNIEYESFTRTELTKIHGDLVDYIAMHEEDDERQRYNDLKRVRRKVAKVMGINEEAEERSSPVPPQRTESRITRSRKDVTSVEEEEGEEEESEEEEEEPMEEEEEEAPKPAKRGRQPRSRPASTQKKKKNTDVLDILSSPTRNPRKPPSRQNTGNRPAAPTRTAPQRTSARRLRTDK